MLEAREKKNDEREWDGWRGDELGCFAVAVALVFVLAMAVLR
jgi:hypothetical protein